MVAKWEKKQFSYGENITFKQRDYFYSSSSFDYLLIKSFVNVYWFLFSEPDGERCAFEPSCSSYLIHAVHEKGVLEAFFMTGDRLNRDSNFIDKYEIYPRKSGKLVDSVTKKH